MRIVGRRRPIASPLRAPRHGRHAWFVQRRHFASFGAKLPPKAYPLRSSGPPALGLSIGLFFCRIVERLGSVRPEAPGVCSLLSKSSRSERYPVRARRAIPPSPFGEGAKGERPQRRIATNWAQRYLVARASPPTPSPKGEQRGRGHSAGLPPIGPSVTWSHAPLPQPPPFGEGEQTINQTPFAPVSTLVLGGAAAPHRDSPRNLSEVDRPLPPFWWDSGQC